MEYQFADPLMYQKGLDLVSLTQYRDAEAQARILATKMQADAFARRQNVLADLAKAADTGGSGEGGTAPIGTSLPGDSANTGPIGTTPAGEKPNLLQLAGGQHAQSKPMWQRQLEKAEENERFAAIALKGGDLDSANKFRDDARQGREQAAKMQKEQTEVQSKQWTDAYNMASAIKDDATLNQTANLLNLKFPGQGLPEQLGFKRGPDGRYIFGADTAQRVKQIQDLALTQKDRIEKEQKFIELGIRQGELERKTEKDAQIDIWRDQVLLLRQAGLTAAADAKQAQLDLAREKLERRQEVDVRTATQGVQATLDKSSTVKTFPQYQQAYAQADAIGAAIANDPKYKNVTAPQMDELKKAYTNMANGFRNRQGGKWEDQNAARFNGLQQNVEKYFKTLGSGTPTLSREAGLQVIDAMREMYGIAAAETLKTEMSARRVARQRGADPDGLQYRVFDDDNIKALLIKRGLIKQVAKDANGKVTKISVAGKEFDVSKDAVEE